MGCKTLGQHTLCNKHLKLCTGDMTYKSLCLFLCLPSALVLAAFYSSKKPICVVEFDTADNDNIVCGQRLQKIHRRHSQIGNVD